MDKNLYKLARQNWQYLHPGTRGLILIDYNFERGFEIVKSQLISILKSDHFFYWLPRIAGVAFVIFISVFALDVFTNPQSLITILQELFVHLIPSFILLTMLGIAWKYERVGGAIFVLTFLMIFALILIRKPLISDLVLFGPLLIIGSLFIIDSYLEHMHRR